MNKTVYLPIVNRNIRTLWRYYSSAKVKILKKSVDLKVEQVFEKYKSGIYYSSYQEDNVVKLGYSKNKALESFLRSKIKGNINENARIKSFPVALKHMNLDTGDFDGITKLDTKVEQKGDTFILNNNPTSSVVSVSQNEHEIEEVEEKEKLNWMKDYEFYEEDEEENMVPYGTPDPTIAASNIPCGGCGARLHCIQESLPGYIPSEIFKGRNKTELQNIICQRCHFLKNYNTALNVSVKPEEYEQLLSTIKDKFGLIVLIVDLLDMPCSIWPNILDIVGRNRPFFIVGNKVDLIPKDSKGYLNSIRNNLFETVTNRGIPKENIRHISLISATTGYGVEELITALHNKWGRKGDVYLVGVTNVGKSSLFNALIRSDYCKVQAADLVKRATASAWPGTTLCMLKFPILRMSDARNYYRTMRLVSEREDKAAEEKLRLLEAKETGKTEHVTLMGHIRQTFRDIDPDQLDSFGMGKGTESIFSLDESKKEFINSKWCYDTPGVMSADQLHNLLTIEELLLVKPTEIIKPRAFLMKPGMSIFLAGIGRLDFLKGSNYMQILVYSSSQLPILICETQQASDIYRDLLKLDVLKVPINDENRLSSWPELKAAEEMIVNGIDKETTAADVVLSSSGWIGINLPKKESAVLQAWTPDARGIYLRQPALLKNGFRLKGSRIRHSLAYKTGKAYIKQ